MKDNKTIAAWLFRPFQFVAGAKALMIGIAVMVVVSLLGYLSQTNFSGVLDIKVNCLDAPPIPYLLHAAFQILVWLTLTIVFYTTAIIVSKSAVRLIDIAGTMAMSQFPLIIAALIGFIPAFHICRGDPATMTVAEMTEMFKENGLMLMIASIVFILFIIWSVILKYNAYSVSANLKGVKAGVSFAIALIVSEILSLVVLSLIIPLIFKL